MSSYTYQNLFPETIVEPVKYGTDVEYPYAMFGGRILSIDAVTESRLLKNVRAHRVLSGIYADVPHYQSGLWNCLTVSEAERLPYFKDQADVCDEKAKIVHMEMQIADNCEDIAKKLKNCRKSGG